MSREWRRPCRTLDAVWSDERIDPRDALRGLNAAQLLDAFDAAAEWCLMSLDPEVQGVALRMREAVDALARGVREDDGRALSVGRLIGIQPPSGLSAHQIISLQGRDGILRDARAAVPDWAALSNRQAARAMRASFLRYVAGGWLIDQQRDTRPVSAPASYWWRLAKLRPDDPASIMPGEERIADLIR